MCVSLIYCLVSLFGIFCVFIDIYNFSYGYLFIDEYIINTSIHHQYINTSSIIIILIYDIPCVKV